MASIALVLIDIQNDYFENGRWPVDNMLEVSSNAARLLEQARVKGHCIIHVRHEIPLENPPFFKPGTPGADIHSSVSPNKDEPVILKHRPNSFQGTALRKNLDDKNITDVVICGAMSQMCIDSTARAAVDFGYIVTVVENACGAKEQVFMGQEVTASQVHASFMAPLAMSFARVITCEQYLQEGT